MIPRKWLVAVGLWLARLGGWEPTSIPVPIPAGALVIPEPVIAMLGRTRTLMEYENAEPNASGEAKRHRVLAKLIKAGATASDAALAIEVVRQRW